LVNKQIKTEADSWSSEQDTLEVNIKVEEDVSVNYGSDDQFNFDDLEMPLPLKFDDDEEEKEKIISLSKWESHGLLNLW
jgi:hypothetical protein